MVFALVSGRMEHASTPCVCRSGGNLELNAEVGIGRGVGNGCEHDFKSEDRNMQQRGSCKGSSGMTALMPREVLHDRSIEGKASISGVNPSEVRSREVD